MKNPAVALALLGVAGLFMVPGFALGAAAVHPAATIGGAAPASLGCSVAVAITATPPIVMTHQMATIQTQYHESGAVRGCNGVATIVYTGLPVGCHTWNTEMLTCAPAAAGIYVVTAHVSYQNGFGSAGTTLRVLA